MIPTADKFFDDVNYTSIIDTVKGIFTSDGSMAVLLDFERVLDEADLYAFKNWELGELVQGPIVKRYSVGCMFMWPFKLMPDPRGARRLIPFDCDVKFKKTKIKVPVKIKNPNDYRPGTHKAKLTEKQVCKIKHLLAFSSDKDIAKQFNVKSYVIHFIRINKTWKHVICDSPDYDE